MIVYRISPLVHTCPLAGTAITSTQYVGAMTRFKAQLKALSAKSANRDAGWNCVMWSSFFFKDAETQMSFFSSADASVVFKGNTMNGCLTSASAGVCPAMTQQGTFDAFKSEYVFTVKTAPVSDAQLAGYVNISKTNTLPVYGQVDFILNAPWQDACPSHYPSYNWSEFEPAAQTGTMSVSFDIRTITSVVAVNMDMTPDLAQFTRVESAFGIDAAGGLPGSYYYNSFYAGMVSQRTFGLLSGEWRLTLSYLFQCFPRTLSFAWTRRKCSDAASTRSRTRKSRDPTSASWSNPRSTSPYFTTRWWQAFVASPTAPSPATANARETKTCTQRARRCPSSLLFFLLLTSSSSPSRHLPRGTVPPATSATSLSDCFTTRTAGT